MIHPLRENLEVHTDSGEAEIRCVKCSFVLAPLDGDWREATRKKLFPPTKAGPLMTELIGQYLLEQLFCPSCGALLETNVVESDDETAGKG